jgi:hypothetical protein
VWLWIPDSLASLGFRNDAERPLAELARRGLYAAGSMKILKGMEA